MKALEYIKKMLNYKKILSFISCFLLTSLIASACVLHFSPVKSWTDNNIPVNNENVVFDNNKKLRGTIFDRNLNPLVYTNFINNAYYYREVNHEYTFAVSFLVSEYGSEQALEKLYEDQLRQNNPVPVNKYDSIGASILTSIDADLDNEIYEILNDSKNGVFITSNIIMIIDGEIRVCVSSPSFDANDYRKHEETRLKFTDSSRLLNRTLVKYPFKSDNAILEGTNTQYDFGSELGDYYQGASVTRLAALAYNNGIANTPVIPHMICGIANTTNGEIIEQIDFSSEIPMDNVFFSKQDSVKVKNYYSYIDTSTTEGVYTVYGYFSDTSNKDRSFSLAMNIIDTEYDSIKNETDAVNFFYNIAKLCAKNIK